MTTDELTRLREEVARLTRERDEACAEVARLQESREAWRRKADEVREENRLLRAAIAPTEANAHALAMSMSEANQWTFDPEDVAEVLAAKGKAVSDRGKAINEMACRYLAANGMPDYGTDQAANFCLGHLATFGMRVAERFATPAPITPSAVDEAERRGACPFCGGPDGQPADMVRGSLRDPKIYEAFCSELVSDGRALERAAVVAWARAEAVKCDGICDMIVAQFAMRLPSDGRWWRAFADRVEACDHIPPATESEADRG